MVEGTISDLGDDLNDEQDEIVVDLLSGIMVGIAPAMIAVDDVKASYIQSEVAEFLTFATTFFEIDHNDVMSTVREKTNKTEGAIKEQAEALCSSGLPEDLSEVMDATVITADSEEEALREIQSLIKDESSSDDPDLDFGNFKYAIVDDDGEVIDNKIYDNFDDAEDQLNSLGSEGLNITEVMV